MMFSLPPATRAKLSSLNVRGEFHGSEVSTQIDLRFEVALPNAILDAFDPALRTCLYMRAPKAHPAAKLPELPGIEPVSDTPALRFPELGMPVKWEAEAAGYALIVDGLELEDVKVGQIRLDCLDGGTVNMDFRVQTTTSPAPELIATLSSLVQRTISIALEPSQAAPTKDVFEDFPEAEVPF